VLNLVVRKETARL